MSSFTLQAAGIVLPDTDPHWTEEVPVKMKRRDPRIWHMAYVAASRAVTAFGDSPKAIVSATGLGALEETRAFLDGVFRTGFGSPRNFIASVHNSMAGKLAIEFSISGPNLTFCEGANSLASAVAGCGALMESDFPVLLVAVEENTEFLRKLSAHLDPDCVGLNSSKWREAAVAFVLTPGSSGYMLSAAGPRSFHGASAEIRSSDLRKLLPHPDAEYIPPEQGAQSFVAPAVAVAEFFLSHRHGSLQVASFSASSRCASVVEICG